MPVSHPMSTQVKPIRIPHKPTQISKMKKNQKIKKSKNPPNNTKREKMYSPTKDRLSSPPPTKWVSISFPPFPLSLPSQSVLQVVFDLRALHGYIICDLHPLPLIHPSSSSPTSTSPPANRHQRLQRHLGRVFLGVIHVLPVVPETRSDHLVGDGDGGGPGGAAAAAVRHDAEDRAGEVEGTAVVWWGELAWCFEWKGRWRPGGVGWM